MKRYSAEYLVDLTTAIFAACGAPPEEATIVAEHLVNSNLMGVDSHGVIRIPLYVKWINDGAIQPGGAISILKEEGGMAIVDCGFNFGQVGALRAIEVAIEKARAHKVSCVITQHCNHIGRLGYFTQKAADAGMFALAAVNSPKTGHNVVPFGGKQGRLATNPISYALPDRDHPVVADMSTSTVAEGKLRVYRNRGEKLPEPWIVDASGRPSTDPEDFYGTPRGWILPFGGALGYKGYALGLLAEYLGGTLAGDCITDLLPDGRNGVCFIVVDISAFVPLNRFVELSGALVDYIKDTSPAVGFEEVMLPGEIEIQTFEERRVKGIPIDPVTWQQIEETARALHVRIPQLPG